MGRYPRGGARASPHHHTHHRCPRHHRGHRRSLAHPEARA